MLNEGIETTPSTLVQDKETNASSVAKLILDRQASGSLPGQRDDGRKVALALEGGGMRGVVSGGMVAALEELRLLNCFDAVYGASAGAISGAYFLARQARYGVTIFYENINNRNFIDLRRFFFSRDPALSLSFLLDKVCIEEKPLNVPRVLSSPIPLRVVCSSVSKLAPVVLSDFNNSADLFTALRASARIPIVAGGPVEYRGDYYFDASVFESIPVRSAKLDGYTDIVVLLTRPLGIRRTGANWVDRFLIAPRLKRYNSALPKIYLARADAYLDELTEILGAAETKAEPRILAIHKPHGTAPVGSHETRRQRLVSGAVDGFKAVYAGLGLPTPEVLEIITPTSRVT